MEQLGNPAQKSPERKLKDESYIPDLETFKCQMEQET